LRDIDGFEGIVMLSRPGESLGLTFWRSREVAEAHLQARMEFIERMTSVAGVKLEEIVPYKVMFAELGPLLQRPEQSLPVRAEVEVGVDVGDVHLGLLQPARVVPVERLPAGELVEHPDPRLARAVARLAVAAEGEVRLGAARGVVDADHAGADLLAVAEGV